MIELFTFLFSTGNQAKEVFFLFDLDIKEDFVY
jgi:hypothetical protein